MRRHALQLTSRGLDDSFVLSSKRPCKMDDPDHVKMQDLPPAAPLSRVEGLRKGQPGQAMHCNLIIVSLPAQKHFGFFAGPDGDPDHVQQQDILPAASLARVEGFCESQPGEKAPSKAHSGRPTGSPLDQVC